MNGILLVQAGVENVTYGSHYGMVVGRRCRYGGFCRRCGGLTVVPTGGGLTVVPTGGGQNASQ